MSKPNIILILTDHFRRDALGVATPNLVALAEEGVRFANAYCAAPLCQPARVSIATGTYPSQNGVCGNQSDPISDSLRDDTYMNHLRAAGYHTALVGKHHFIDRYGLGVDVRQDDGELARYGFDDVLQVTDDGENQHNEDEYTAYLRGKGMLDEFRAHYSSGVRERRHPFAASDTADGFIGERGIEFVERYSDDKPFYLSWSFIGPHPPYWHPGELEMDPTQIPPALGAPDSESTRRDRAHYLQKCALIDRYVGSMVKMLKKRGLYENTIIIFTSDHGDNLGDYGIWDKRFFFEQSVGVPLMMRGPGIGQGVRRNGPLWCKALVSHLDLYPTLLAIAEAGPAVTAPRAGLDIQAILRGDRNAMRSELFAQLGTAVMVRTGNWKMVYDPEQGGVQYLFNLAVDTKELHNLANVAGYENVTREMLERMLSNHIRLAQRTQIKEEQRVQRVRIANHFL